MAIQPIATAEPIPSPPIPQNLAPATVTAQKTTDLVVPLSPPLAAQPKVIPIGLKQVIRDGVVTYVPNTAPAPRQTGVHTLADLPAPPVNDGVAEAIQTVREAKETLKLLGDELEADSRVRQEIREEIDEAIVLTREARVITQDAIVKIDGIIRTTQDATAKIDGMLGTTRDANAKIDGMLGTTRDANAKIDGMIGTTGDTNATTDEIIGSTRNLNIRIDALIEDQIENRRRQKEIRERQDEDLRRITECLATVRIIPIQVAPQDPPEPEPQPIHTYEEVNRCTLISGIILGIIAVVAIAVLFGIQPAAFAAGGAIVGGVFTWLLLGSSSTTQNKK